MLDERSDPHSRAFHVIVVACFTALIFAPWLDLFRSAEASGPRAAELREPAPAPEAVVGVRELRRYPGQFEEHFDDTFGFRDWFLRGHSLVKLFLFGVSPTPRVLLGKDGWLFYTGNQTVEDFRGLVPFTADELSDWQRMLEGRRRFLAQRGIDYVFVIVPNKEEIYPEYMPDSLAPLGPRRIDQFLEHMRAHTTVDVLDLRPALLAAKSVAVDESEVYLKLGSHWNGAGSYAAYAALIEHLRERHPELAPPLPREALEVVPVAGNADSWGRAMYVDDLLRQDVVAYKDASGAGVRTVADTGSAPDSEHTFECRTAPPVKAMFFHDSFGPYNYRLLAASFQELSCHWRSDFPEKLIAEHRPEIVIEQFVQRCFVTTHPDGGPPQLMDEVGFRELEHVLLRLDLPEDVGRLEGVEGCRVSVEAGDAEARGARVEFGGKRDLLRLPSTEAGGGEAVLMLELTAPVEGRLSVFFALDGEDLPLRRNSFRARLEGGRSRVFVPLDDPRTTGRLFLRTAAEPGSLVLHAVEIRTSRVP